MQDTLWQFLFISLVIEKFTSDAVSTDVNAFVW